MNQDRYNTRTTRYRGVDGRTDKAATVCFPLLGA